LFTHYFVKFSIDVRRIAHILSIAKYRRSLKGRERLDVWRALSPRARHARGTEPEPVRGQHTAPSDELPPLTRIVLGGVRQGAIQPDAAEKLLAAIFRPKA